MRSRCRLFPILHRTYNLHIVEVKIQSRHLRVNDPLRGLIDRHSHKIRRMLPTFQGPDLELHISLERLPRGNQFQTVLVLTTPQTTLRVEDMETSAATSVGRAFDELFRKVKRFKSRLNREQFWQRETSNRQPAPLPPVARELENAINSSLDRVEGYIRRELFHRALVDGIPADALQPEAVLDEVFLEVTAKPESRPEQVPVEQWMIQISREAIDRRVQSLLLTEDDRHVEDRVRPELDWEDETLHFHQPDEILHVEDLISDRHMSTPEDLIAKEEVRERLQKAVALLPRSIRESFVLFDMEGFSSDEVAMVTGKDPAQVLEDVERARLELREQLGSQSS